MSLQTVNGSSRTPKCLFDPSVFSFQSISTAYSPLPPVEEPSCAYWTGVALAENYTSANLVILMVWVFHVWIFLEYMMPERKSLTVLTANMWFLHVCWLLKPFLRYFLQRTQNLCSSIYFSVWIYKYIHCIYIYCVKFSHIEAWWL